MNLSITKVANNSVAVYAAMGKEKPILLHRVIINWLDGKGTTFLQNFFRPNQFIEENISILVASMPIANGAVAVEATADYDVVEKVAKASKLNL